ncbi:hypothetical protein REIFOR_03234 [Reinekea forsetii]|uniref:Uncharacterized protein n=1 Tax=Reinekea forsetii TaxID=1336806 RepID=A0A2K8KUC2_9GAMM|nr:hypothetical protein REIFOR_03234 [Reinekea forsetii]
MAHVDIANASGLAWPGTGQAKRVIPGRSAGQPDADSGNGQRAAFGR